MLSGQQDAREHSGNAALNEAVVDKAEDEPMPRGRPRRAAQQNRIKAKPVSRKHTEGYDSLESMDDESEATSSGNEWDGGDEDEPDDNIDDEEEDEDVDMTDNSGTEEEDDDPQQSLVVSLRYARSNPSPTSQGMWNGLLKSTNSDDHGINPMTTDNPKDSSEMASLADSPSKTSNEATKTTSGAAHHRSLAEHAAPSQHDTPNNPQPQVSHSNQSIRVAHPENDNTSFHPDYSQSGHPTPAVS